MGQLFLTNALITGNTAATGGSGIANCPTSSLHIYVTNGAAIIDNTNDELFVSNTQQETHGGTPTLHLSSRMLGGNPYNWEVLSSTDEVNLDNTLDQEIPVENEIDFGNNPEYTYKERASQLATVTISGNTGAKYGGGIGSNGDVTIGTPDETEVSGEKTWNDDNKDGVRPESITIKLFADGDLIETKEVTEADDWKYTFSHLPTTVGGQAITYTIEEEPVAKYDAEYDGYNVSNTYNPEKPEEPEEPDKPNKPEEPKKTTKKTTSVESRAGFYAGMALFAVFGIVLFRRRKQS